MTDSCKRGRFSGAMLKKKFSEPVRLFDLLDQMISITRWNLVPRSTVSPKIFQKDIHARPFATAVAGPDAVCLQCLHDLRLVWASEIQGEPAAARHHGELGHRVVRILAGGARQSLGQRGLYAGTAQDHAGSDHADRVRGIFGAVSEGAAGLESRPGFCADRCGRVFHFSQMVVTMPAVIASASEEIQRAAKRDAGHRGLSRKKSRMSGCQRRRKN